MAPCGNSAGKLGDVGARAEQHGRRKGELLTLRYHPFPACGRGQEEG
jgi:hypothetical protein